LRTRRHRSSCTAATKRSSGFRASNPAGRITPSAYPGKSQSRMPCR
jgi:hypothetical protein